jgi:hypothetical protein
LSVEYYMIGIFVWLVGSIAVVAHLHNMGIRGCLVKTAFGLFWPFIVALTLLSIMFDIIWARGDVKRVQKAYKMKRKELEGIRDDANDD